jgi:hypothetical protein
MLVAISVNSRFASLIRVIVTEPCVIMRWGGRQGESIASAVVGKKDVPESCSGMPQDEKALAAVFHLYRAVYRLLRPQTRKAGRRCCGLSSPSRRCLHFDHDILLPCQPSSFFNSSWSVATVVAEQGVVDRTSAFTSWLRTCVLRSSLVYCIMVLMPERQLNSQASVVYFTGAMIPMTTVASFINTIQ